MGSVAAHRENDSLCPHWDYNESCAPGERCRTILSFGRTERGIWSC
jgi:hypothetical protein